MHKLRIAAFASFLLVSAAAVGFAAWFRVVKHVITTRLQPPHLKLQRTSAIDFTLYTLDGTPTHLSNTKGKVVFLDLWGTWCVQCVAEMPTIQRLYDHYRNDPDVQFLIVSRMDTPAQVSAYAAHNHYTLPFYRMNDDDIPPAMQLGQFPSTFLYAKDGALIAQHTGAADWSATPVLRVLDTLKAE